MKRKYGLDFFEREQKKAMKNGKNEGFNAFILAVKTGSQFTAE